MPTDILVVTVLAFLFLNIAASLWMLRSDAYEPAQKRLQLLLVWLLPVLGALLVIVMLCEDRRVTKPALGDHFEPPENPPGTGLHGL